MNKLLCWTTPLENREHVFIIKCRSECEIKKTHGSLNNVKTFFLNLSYGILQMRPKHFEYFQNNFSTLLLVVPELCFDYFRTIFIRIFALQGYFHNIFRFNILNFTHEYLQNISQRLVFTILFPDRDNWTELKKSRSIDFRWRSGKHGLLSSPFFNPLLITVP